MADALVISGLSKRFGGLRAVQDVSFTVKENETVALIGPNGAGKTTSFHLITGFHRAGVRPMKAGDKVKARGLAGAVRPDQRDGLVFLHRETDVLNGAQAAEPFAEAADNERICHGLASQACAGLRAAKRCRTSLIMPISPVGRQRITAIRIRL